jgi:hypothetical protein
LCAKNLLPFHHFSEISQQLNSLLQDHLLKTKQNSSG